jgi:dipeptidyl aminopeptidase/acylaminoacyl peptidase
MSSVRITPDFAANTERACEPAGAGPASTITNVTTYRDFEPTVRFREALAVSPDGTQLAYVDDGPGHFNLAIRPLVGGPPRCLTSYTDSDVRHAEWHPDGRSLLYVADSAGDEHHQLYLLDVASGTPTPLTDSRSVSHWQALGDSFSPDGKYLAYAGNDRSPADQDVLIRDLATGEVRRIYSGGGRIYAGHWSPDGTRLTAVNWRGAVTDQVMYVLSINDGRVTQLTPDDESATYIPGPWLPDGSGVLVMSDHGRDVAGLGVLDVETGHLSWLDASDWDVEDVALSRDGRVLAWLVNVDGASQLRARSLATGEPLATPTLPMGSASQLRLTPDGRSAVTLMSTPAKPWNVLVVDLATGDLRWVTDAHPAADPSAFVEPVLVHCPARNGRRVPAYLYRPSGIAGRVPVVLAIHGGPPIQEKPNYSNDGLFQYLVSRGVAVIAPNVRGSSGYGLAYQRAVHRDWGGVDLDDLDDTVRYLKNQPWVDPTRIGLIGRSYGGFGVLSCVARLPEHDWAAVAWCAPSNLVTFTRAQPPTWRAQVAIMIGDPDTDAEFLASRSPVTYADQIKAPLFLIQGANDTRVPRQESDQIVHRLRERGVEVRYDVYPDEGHVFGSSAHQTKARTDGAEFLLDHLVPTGARLA